MTTNSEIKEFNAGNFKVRADRMRRQKEELSGESQTAKTQGGLETGHLQTDLALMGRHGKMTKGLSHVSVVAIKREQTAPNLATLRLAHQQSCNVHRERSQSWLHWSH